MDIKKDKIKCPLCNIIHEMNVEHWIDHEKALRKLGWKYVHNPDTKSSAGHIFVCNVHPSTKKNYGSLILESKE